CGAETRSSSWCRSPVNVSDCQSVDCTSVSRILSRGTPARAISARIKLDAAGDMVIFSIAPPPDRQAPARPSWIAVHGRCEDRKRSAGHPIHPGRIGWESRHVGEEILAYIPLK